MITHYSIENFKSIKTEQKISFISRKVKSNRLVFDNKLLPVISLYGPNGGGKSSLIESIGFITNFIKDRNDIIMLNQKIVSLSFLNNKSQTNTKDTKWKFGFLTEGDLYYEYEIWINNRGISLEKLYRKEGLKSESEMQLVFERTNDKILLSEEIKKTKVIVDQIPGSLLSYLGSIINDEDIMNVYNHFNKIILFKSNLFDPLVVDVSARLLYNFDLNVLEEEKDKILKILSDMDINIENIMVSSTALEKNVLIRKRGPNGSFDIPFDFESDGTKKIIQLLCLFIKHIHNGSIFCIDEVDSQLHTKLLGYIIDMFNSKINKNSQIIFSSHDMATLSNKYFRKDEIYFAALNELNFTDIVCLADFGDEIRENTSISNKYLKGHFGYDPYVKKCEGWEENE